MYWAEGHKVKVKWHEIRSREKRTPSLNKVKGIYFCSNRRIPFHGNLSFGFEKVFLVSKTADLPLDFA